MNKRLCALFLTLSVMFMFTGCQLACKDCAAENGQDKLIGMYISYEYVDLFDFEGYMNDHARFSGGEIKIDGNTQDYQGRMYAVRTDEVQTASNGEESTYPKYVFEELEGFGMFAPSITDPNNDYGRILSDYDEGFADVNTHVNCGDDKDGLELEGCIYMSTGAVGIALHNNPVYQSADGRVYLVAGDGFSFTGENDEGSVYTVTLTDEATIHKNGKRKTYSTSVKVAVSAINPTEQVTILQMDKDSNILKKNTYLPEEVPKELQTEPAAEYIIVESTKRTHDKQIEIERTLFSKDEEELWFFYEGNHSVCIKAYSTILWDLPT